MKISKQRRRMALCCAALAAMALAFPAASGNAAATPAVAGPTALLHGHSHNDYNNDPPLTAALDRGYTSIEADVWLDSEGTLVTCHAYDAATGACESDSGGVASPYDFDATYLQGLSTWISDHGGVVYPGYTQPIHLLVEIKCAAPSNSPCEDGGAPPGETSHNNPLVVLGEIENELAPYASILYTSAHTSGQVQVIITGGHNGEQYAADSVSTTSVSAVLHAQYNAGDAEAYLDGTLGSGYASPDPVEPLLSYADPQISNTTSDASCYFTNYAALTTAGQPTSTLQTEILDAHANGHEVRVYGMPDCPAGHDAQISGTYKMQAELAWQDAAAGGVDYLSGNHIDTMAAWLGANDNVPVGGGGSCGARQTINGQTGLKAQYCTLWTGDVPVHAAADANSATVGTLVNGGDANWFVAQTQGVTAQTSGTSWCYPGNPAWCNDWWAYTQADNGQWGWVSVVYFAGGTNNEPADDLYGCGTGTGTAEGALCHPY